jgi:predicted PurR-regulated permease PerM
MTIPFAREQETDGTVDPGLSAPSALDSSRRPVLRTLFGAACAVLVLAGARTAAELVDPVLMASFLALLLQPFLNKLRPLRGAAVPVIVLVVLLTGLVLVGFVGASLRQVALEAPRYQTQFQSLVASITQRLAERGINVAAYIQSALTGPVIGRVALGISRAVAGGFGSLVLTLFIFAFVLGGLGELERRASKEARDHSSAAERFLAFSVSLRGYVGVRALLGLAAAFLNYLLLLTVGVEHALLWGVLSFLYSFVPNVGFLLSLLPPTMLALLNGGWVNAAVVVGGYIVINVVLDNVVAPQLIARQMEISPLLSFLSVIFWAWLLGPTGAILAVPLTVLIQQMVFGSADPPDIGTPKPVTPSAVAPPNDV